jgi:hypothetical protein
MPSPFGVEVGANVVENWAMTAPVEQRRRAKAYSPGSLRDVLTISVQVFDERKLRKCFAIILRRLKGFAGKMASL